MKLLIRLALALVALSIAALPALAGLKKPNVALTITTGDGTSKSAGSAQGALGSTRNNSSTTQYIGCWAELQEDSHIEGGCYAGGLSNKPDVSCKFPVGAMPQYLERLTMMNSDSYIGFGWDAYGSTEAGYNICNLLVVNSFSFDEPKN